MNNTKNRNKNDKEFELSYITRNKFNNDFKVNNTKLTEDEIKISKERLDKFIKTINKWIVNCRDSYYNRYGESDDNSDRHLNLRNLSLSNNPEQYDDPSIYNISILYKNFKGDDCNLYFDTLGKNDDNVPSLIFIYKSTIMKLKCYNLDDNLNKNDKYFCFLYLIFKKALYFYNAFPDSELNGVNFKLKSDDGEYYNIHDTSIDFIYISSDSNSDEYKYAKSAEQFMIAFDAENEKTLNMEGFNITINELFKNGIHSQNLLHLAKNNTYYEILLRPIVNSISKKIIKLIEDSKDDVYIKLLTNINHQNEKEFISTFGEYYKEFTKDLSSKFTFSMKNLIDEDFYKNLDNESHTHINELAKAGKIDINSLNPNHQFNQQNNTQQQMNYQQNNIPQEITKEAFEEMATTSTTANLYDPQNINHQYSQQVKLNNIVGHINNTNNQNSYNNDFIATKNPDISERKLKNKTQRKYRMLNGKVFYKEIPLDIPELTGETIGVRSKVDIMDTRLQYIYDYYMILQSEEERTSSFIKYFKEAMVDENKVDYQLINEYRNTAWNPDIENQTFEIFSKEDNNKETVNVGWLDNYLCSDVFTSISYNAFGEQGNVNDYHDLVDYLSFEFKFTLYFMYHISIKNRKLGARAEMVERYIKNIGKSFVIEENN